MRERSPASRWPKSCRPTSWHSRRAAQLEFRELEAFVREVYGIDRLNAWDVSYYSEKLRQRDFDISQEELRVYFPVGHALDGLFEITGRLYGVEIRRQENVETWHEQVQFFEIFREGRQIASVYLDLFPREGKRGGAWMAGCRHRRRPAEQPVRGVEIVDQRLVEDGVQGYPRRVEPARVAGHRPQQPRRAQPAGRDGTSHPGSGRQVSSP